MRNITVNYSKGKLGQNVSVGPHRLIADVAQDLGGEDSGPSPHEFLAAALGSCTAITLKMYASRKSWPLENTEVSVTMDGKADLTRFTRMISLIGPLSEEQKARLLEIANHCPVHQTLTGKIDIQTTLK